MTDEDKQPHLRTAGWFRPAEVPERHYFQAGQVRSLCRAVLGYGPRRMAAEMATASDTCPACQAEYEKLEVAGTLDAEPPSLGGAH